MTEALPRRRLPRLQREQQLLDVAEEVFATRGLRMASMQEIALRAGITKPILYDHFGSKDGLVVACIRRARAQLLEDIPAAVAGASGPREVLEAGVAAFFRFVESHGKVWFMLIGESSLAGTAADELETIRRQQAGYVAQRLAADFPAARRDDLDAIAEAITGACERVALWRRDRPDVSAATASRNVVSLLWGGLASLSRDGLVASEKRLASGSTGRRGAR
jgi:AcrR family transcriptional regulator